MIDTVVTSSQWCVSLAILFSAMESLIDEQHVLSISQTRRSLPSVSTRIPLPIVPINLPRLYSGKSTLDFEAQQRDGCCDILLLLHQAYSLIKHNPNSTLLVSYETYNELQSVLAQLRATSNLPDQNQSELSKVVSVASSVPQVVVDQPFFTNVAPLEGPRRVAKHEEAITSRRNADWLVRWPLNAVVE